MALPNTTVEIAFNAGYTTAAASRTWTDVSAYVEGAQGLNIGRGRGDEVSQVQPSRLSLTLNNRDGRFTPRLASGAYYPNVKKGRPIRITCTYNAVSYVRYLGYVSEWPVSWPDGTSADCVVRLTSASRMARMGRGAELLSVIEQEILADSPSAYYTLGEPAEATAAGDSSGNQQPMSTTSGTGTAVVFGTATGPGTDGLTAATFAGGQYLSVQLSAAPSVLECCFSTTTTPGVNTVSTIFSTGSGNPIGVHSDGKIHTSTGVDLTGPVVTDGNTHHLVWQSGHVYLDGVDIGSPTTSPTGSVVTIGGGGEGGPPAGVGVTFNGVIAHAAAYSSLSAARAAAHSSAALTGFAGETAAARITRLSGYATIPAAELSAGTSSSTIGHFDITGMTPIAAMQKVTETENGVLYDAKDGTFTFKGRSARYTVASSFTLNATAQEVEADLEPRDDDQFVINDVTATANGQPAGRVIDSTSRSEQGVYSKNLDTVTNDATDALYGAQWAVSVGADPPPRYTTVTVDVTNSSTSQAALVLAAEIGTRFTLTNLPSQAPGSSVDLFVEGYAETVTATRHTIKFNTSPAAPYDVWTIEDAVFGAYDTYPLSY